MSLQYVSHSSLRSFQECPRKYTYLYHDKRVPNTVSPALQVGTFVHKALEVWWTDGPEAAATWCAENSSELGEAEVAKIVAMLGNYNPPAEDFELIENEAEFEISARHPVTQKPIRGVRVVGFADGLLRRKSDGALVVRECKTTASEILGFGPYWQRLSIDSQVGIYAVAFQVETVIYDVLRKPQLRLSLADKAADNPAEAFQARIAATIAKEPEAWHQWREIRINDDDRALAQRALWDAVKALRMAEKEKVFPMHTGSCAGFGTCKFLGVCTGNDDLSDPVRFRDKLSRAEREAAEKAGG